MTLILHTVIVFSPLGKDELVGPCFVVTKGQIIQGSLFLVVMLHINNAKKNCPVKHCFLL